MADLEALGESRGSEELAEVPLHLSSSSSGRTSG